jgi:putative membrane protein
MLKTSIMCLLFVACAKTPVETAPPVPPSAVSLAIERLPEPDRQFVRQAMGANLAAIQMGRLAMQRGTSDRIKAIGRDLVDTHTQLQDRMRQAAREEDNIILPLPQMTADQKSDYDRLARLSGFAFDQAFLAILIKNQDETIRSFNQQALNGKDTALRDLANDTLPLLNDRVRWVRREIQQL